MKKVLLVDEGPGDMAPLADLLEGFETRVLVAPGGLYALTMLEREQPQLLLTRFYLGDMDGLELCSLIKRDDLLADIRVVLLARNLDEKLAAERAGIFDLVLIDDRPIAMLASTLKQLIERGMRPVGAPSQASDQAIAGTLGVLSFAELTQALSQTGKTGRLILDREPGDDRAVVLFHGGRVRHVAYRRGLGAEAFAHLYSETERGGNTVFRFEPMTEDDMAIEPQTLDGTAQQLLLSAAVELDHYNTTQMPAVSRSDILGESAGDEPVQEARPDRLKG